MTQIDILSLGYDELLEELLLMGEPKFRAKQIFSWLHEKKVTSFSEMTTLSLQLREKLKEKFCLNRLKIVKRLASSIDDTVKYSTANKCLKLCGNSLDGISPWS